MSAKLIIANWKMNPETKEQAEHIASEIRAKTKGAKSKVVMCPPFVYIHEVAEKISGAKNIMLGAQDVFQNAGSAHTGEVSPEMLKSAGVKYIIVGHSEKRAAGDTDEVVREKLFTALKKFKAILCVGEKERNTEGEYFSEIQYQLKSALTKLPKMFVKNLVIAYEPVWAIGKSEKEAMKPHELAEMVIFIKRVVSDILKIKNPKKIMILYGGSVTAGNAKNIIEGGNVSGLLVGRESLKAEEFSELVKELD